MTLRTHSVRYFFVIVLMLSLSAVYSSSAQSTALTQIAKTLDGEISIRLPAGWQSRDTAASIFTSVLAIGDNAQSLQSVIDSLTSTPNATTATMNGIIGIVNPQFVSGLSTDMAISTLLNSLISGVQQQGGQILEQQSILLGGQYPASIALVSIAAEQAKGYIGVFQAGTNIGEFTIGATPERSFDANQQMFIDMMNSIRMPAETGSSLPPTAAVATAVPVNPPPPGDQAVTASPNGVFSVRLPSGWQSQPTTVENFGDTIVFGDSTASLTGSRNFLVIGNSPGSFSGVGGMIGVVNVGQQAFAPLVTPLMQSLLGILTGTGAQLLQQPQAHVFGNQYDGQLALTSIGPIAVMYSDTQILVAILLTDDTTANSTEMNAILESIRMPAETPDVVPSEEVNPVTPEAVPTEEAVALELQTARSGDLRVSVGLPAEAVMLDHVADANILAFGDSAEAAEARLFSAKPDLATETAITGNGGLIILYPMSQFGIDPANPDLSALMTRALGNLQGYTIEQEAEPLESIPNALYAVISGAEHGYLALLPFDDQIAYVTATSASRDEFEQAKATLLAVVESVRVPAEPEPTPAPTASGLGGLGGLDETVATPEVTPEATAAGLSGL